ncbi:sensor histidine kinase [Amycolatopsis sp., V23-08]|uniref:Sensor histidine kinase n=1 Tax=Amycolatopsis heterodermiae TaxID=3110235 RepID=A0ABU5RPC0_9PSEU|nr:sensor histidine kinase [Amycolatopsis sp., V23-08]MEA5367835.1 sensor histidine kinase [Amycolatopsis sp., V23-08]
MNDSTVPADAQRWVHGWRRLVLDAGMLAYPLVTVPGVLAHSSGTAAVAGCAIVAGFAVAYVFAAFAAARRSWPRYWVFLGICAVLFAAVLPFAHAEGFFLAAVVVSLAGMSLRRYTLVLGALSALAALFVPWVVWDSGPGWPQAVALFFTVLVVYAFGEAVRANTALVEARAEVARLASEAERARIARDLHDLLGHSLTAITVKSTLARRLLDTEAARAGEEMTAVETLARQALTDVRAAVSGYAEVTLAGELARGRELLRACGVAAELPTAVDVVGPDHQELFGWVVREGLTNVARHARATRCAVTLSASSVEVVDDGLGGSATEGTGLSGLRERVAAAGGRVEAGPVSPRGWRLCVSLTPVEVP